MVLLRNLDCAGGTGPVVDAPRAGAPNTEPPSTLVAAAGVSDVVTVGADVVAAGLVVVAAPNRPVEGVAAAVLAVVTTLVVEGVAPDDGAPKLNVGAAEVDCGAGALAENSEGPEGGAVVFD